MNETSRPPSRPTRAPMLLTALLTVAGLTACSAPEPDATPATDMPPADAGQLMEADRTFASEVAARGIDAWVEAFAEDGAMLRPGAEVRGHGAIREAMAGAFSSPGSSLTWDPTHAEISSSGDLGYTIGRYVSTAPGPDGPTTSEGAYTTVWRRNPAGDWKVVLDLGVPDPPPR
ncbi:MAG: nuclear transport factor 2 family protein [Gemmatimonadota bacterium]|nr:nuclear transport factor 2 family protein [Gemmatimonadota bacterium]